MKYLPAEFPHENDLCYLNHAAVSPWPKSAAEAVQRFAFENMTCGAEQYPHWMKVEQSLREKLQWLINAASADDIALVKNTSEGLSFVAAGLAWQDGDQIIGIADDFPSNRIVWEALAERGVRFIGVDTHVDDPEAALLAQITPRTRLLAVSSVHFATGVRLDLARLSAACRAQGVLLCVDAIQSLGAVRLDLQQIPVDFVVADGHKWLLGPEGLGLFYVNPRLRNSLKLTQYGWAMRENPGDYSTSAWEPAQSARRFEPGSPNMLGIHALEASLQLLQDSGFEYIEQNLRKNTARLREAINEIDGLVAVTPSDAARSAGILAFRTQGVELDLLYQRLMAARVICASRGGYLRLSPHFYTREATLELATQRIREIVADLIR